MRLLYASERPPYPFFLGGAARCAHRLLLSMTQDLGVDCIAIGSADYSLTRWTVPHARDLAALGVRAAPQALGPDTSKADALALDCAYPVRAIHDFPQALATLIDEYAPDVIWSQLEGAGAVLSTALAKGIPGVLYVHDAEDSPAELRATAQLGCQVVCSSEFLARKTAKAIGRPAHVVYPASDWYFGTVRQAEGFVTLVNPHAVKGLDTFLDIARHLPQRRFLLQESWKLGDTALQQLQQRLAAFPNVHFQHRVPDMRAVYAQTRLLLVPSVWEEGFGMVAVEAQSCGIPVIASARGGLPESVGDGGTLIEDHRNVVAWVDAIEAVLASDQAYRTASARALVHAQSIDFSAQEMARRFLGICVAPAPPRAKGPHGVRHVLQRLRQLPGLKSFVERTKR